MTVELLQLDHCFQIIQIIFTRGRHSLFGCFLPNHLSPRYRNWGHLVEALCVDLNSIFLGMTFALHSTIKYWNIDVMSFNFPWTLRITFYWVNLSQHICEACGQTIPSVKDTPGPSSRNYNCANIKLTSRTIKLMISFNISCIFNCVHRYGYVYNTYPHKCTKIWIVYVGDT